MTGIVDNMGKEITMIVLPEIVYLYTPEKSRKIVSSRSFMRDLLNGEKHKFIETLALKSIILGGCDDKVDSKS